MSYEVQYHTNLCRDIKIPKERGKSIASIKWLLLAVALTIVISIPGRDFWIDCLIPGDTQITTSAVETLAGNIQNGNPINEAFQEFCLEIVQGE